MSDLEKMSDRERYLAEIRRLEGVMEGKRSTIGEMYKARIEKWETVCDAAAEAYVGGDDEAEKQMARAAGQLVKVKDERDAEIEAAIKDMKGDMAFYQQQLNGLREEARTAPNVANETQVGTKRTRDSCSDPGELHAPGKRSRRDEAADGWDACRRYGCGEGEVGEWRARSTPLHLAADKGNADLVAHLIGHHGGQVTAVDNTGMARWVMFDEEIS
eukprot:TRINITY_DN5041_c0_g1_i2.p1 TRINITY_DN5041_c0_g1~~TRINITY_DN5041_c0_g1_i2.p1  ORF type:complete len:216 (+),score=58.39 TRINITY_DN5041_c0_g1_i2:79-726(+)